MGGGHHISSMYSRGINLVVGPLAFACYLICTHWGLDMWGIWLQFDVVVSLVLNVGFWDMKLL